MLRNFQEDPEFLKQKINECLNEQEDEFKDKLDDMVKRFRQAQSRHREERQKKVAAVKCHFDRFEKVMFSKREQEAINNYNQLSSYVHNQRAI